MIYTSPAKIIRIIITHNEGVFVFTKSNFESSFGYFYSVNEFAMEFDILQRASSKTIRTSLIVWSKFFANFGAPFRSFRPPTSPFGQPSRTEYFTVGFVAAHLAPAGFLSRRSDGLELATWFDATRRGIEITRYSTFRVMVRVKFRAGCTNVTSRHRVVRVVSLTCCDVTQQMEFGLNRQWRI